MGKQLTPSYWIPAQSLDLVVRERLLVTVFGQVANIF